MKLVKAEILWTRQCPLKCSYCAMADGRANNVPLKDWFLGIRNLHFLGCRFIAFYGAEPLYDRYKDLAATIGYAERMGIHTTVITSGMVPDVEGKLRYLYDEGCRSLSVSYDIRACDKSAILKTKKALNLLRLFKSFGPVRDLAAIATIGEHNFEMIPKAISQLSAEGIWFFFDILHPDRHQPGSKCSGSGEPYLIKRWSEFADILQFVLEMKNDGLLCHTSRPFINFLTHNINVGTKNIMTCWNCADEKEFPGWVTIDCNGLVYPCDDFQPKVYSLYEGSAYKPITMKNILSHCSRFTDMWKQIVKRYCPGCLWNTHYDTFRIKDGSIPFSDYVHTGGE